MKTPTVGPLRTAPNRLGASAVPWSHTLALMVAVLLSVGCKSAADGDGKAEPAAPGNAASTEPSSTDGTPGGTAGTPTSTAKGAERPKAGTDPSAPEGSSTKPSAPPDLSADERSRLEGAFVDSWCLLARRDRAGLKAVWARYRYEDVAAFSAAWAAATALDAKWAEEVMARVVGGSCSPASR